MVDSIQPRANWPIVGGENGSPRYLLYTTRHGDSLSAIAQRFLKDADRWPNIYEVNKDKLPHPDQLERGVQLRIPLDPVKAAAPPQPPAPPQPIRLQLGETCNVTAPAQGGMPATSICFGTYTVKKGESLSAIANKLWQDEDRWVDLFRANRDLLADPELLTAGMVLKVPSEAELKTLRAEPLAAVTERKPLPKDREMLARAVLAEARGAGPDVQKAVATAIVNYATSNDVSLTRLVRSSYLSSNYDGNKIYYTRPLGQIPANEWLMGVAAAEDAFRPDSTGRALIGDRDHFFDDSIRTPPWGKKSTQIKVGRMYFLKAR